MKTIKIIGIFISFLSSILFHFMYEFYPNYVFSILFPVNESIWEHMKLINTSTLFYAIIEYFLYKKYSINFNNFTLSYGLAIIISIFIYILIYIPIHLLFGHNTIFSIILLFLTFILVQYISYKIINLPKANINGLPLILMIYLIFAVLTHKPPFNFLFYDTQSKIYGIKKTP